MTNTLNRTSIKPLTTLRGIFACCVLLFHCGDKNFMQLATGGVVFFFILRGFLMSMHHDSSKMRGRVYRDFLKGRAFKIYPIHWLTLFMFVLITTVFHEQGIYWNALVPNFLLLHCYIPIRSYFFSFNTVSWFLCDILLCYVCYPFISRVLHRLRLRSQLSLIAVLFISYSIFMYPWDSVADESVIRWSHVFPLFRLFEFSMGIVAHHCYQALKARCAQWNRVKATLWEVAAVGLIAALIVADQQHHGFFRDNYDDSIMWELPMSFLIIVSSLNSGREGLLGCFLSWRPLVWMGGISMEIFLLQSFAGRFYNFIVCPVLAHLGYLGCYTNYWLILPLLIPMAWVVHRYFSKPIFRKSRILTHS